MNIITGYTGEKHISAADDAALLRGIVGTSCYVLKEGSEFAATVISATEIRVADGELVMQGRHARIETGYDTLEIANGTQNRERNDLIVARYTMNASTQVESIGLVVIQGTSATTATDPVYNTGNIDDGEMKDFPLYRVKVKGITIEKVEPLFDVVTPMQEHMDLLAAHTNQLKEHGGMLETFRTQFDNYRDANGKSFGIIENSIKGLNTTLTKQGNTVAANTKAVSTLREVLGFNESASMDDNLVAAALKLGAKPQLFWQNSSPTAAFANENVDLNGMGAPLYLVEFRVTRGITRYITVIAAEGRETDVSWIEGLYLATKLTYHARKFKISNGVASFEYASAKTSDDLLLVAQDMGSLIPTKIYGVNVLNG